jgi:hypothetical protein
MTTYLEKRRGGGGENPTEQDLIDALSELRQPDPAHPDCWLSNENGWTIAAHESGKVVLENPEGDEGPWHLPHADQILIMILWHHLQAGELDAIRKYQWKEGYK